MRDCAVLIWVIVIFLTIIVYQLLTMFVRVSSKMLHKFVSISLLSSASIAYAADMPIKLRPSLSEKGFSVEAAPDYTDRQFDWHEWMQEKFLEPLEAKRRGILKPDTIYIHSLFRGSFIAETTNVANKFPLLSRFPAQHSGTSGSRFTINNAILGVTANAGDWVTLTSELMYTETEYPGQAKFQVRRAFMTVGNLNVTPFYLGVGKNFVDFGDMGSYSPFTHTMNNHYFQVQSEDPVVAVGYSKNGWHLVATAIQGGRQLRVADSPTTNQVSNFALNASKTLQISQDLKAKVGVGYLNNTIYNTLVPHHTTAQAASQVKVNNAAYDINATLSYKNFDVQGEFNSTVNKWIASDHLVQAMTLQARYNTQIQGYKTAFSVGWGKGIQGASGTNFEQMTQILAGAQVKVHRNLSLGVEYAFGKGFVPLMDLRNTGDQNVRSHTVITGLRAHF
jgi:opacity protein-like surface antigen